MEKGCKGTSGGVSGVCACVCTCVCRRGGLKHLEQPRASAGVCDADAVKPRISQEGDGGQGASALLPVND